MEKPYAPLLIIKNIAREGPGLLVNACQRKNFGFKVWEAAALPASVGNQDYSGLVVLGGPASANDLDPWMQREIRFVADWVADGRPYLGVCLGMQVLVKACGGEVLRSEHKEVGFLDPEKQHYSMDLTEEGRRDALLLGLPNQIPIFQLHGETVRLPPDGKLLATGRWCRMQMVRFGQAAYGIQGHLEIDWENLQRWLGEDPDLAGFAEESLRAQYESFRRQSEQHARALLDRFLDLCAARALRA